MRETYSIEDKTGSVIGTISFDPYNAAEMEKITAAWLSDKELQKIARALKGISIRADGTTQGMIFSRKLRTAEGLLKSIFDRSLGIGKFDEFFYRVRPFASVNGDFFCLSVIDAVGKILNARMQEVAAELRATQDGERISADGEKEDA